MTLAQERTAMPQCPPVDVLERLLNERLSDGEQAGVENHVEHCPACQGTLARLLAARQGAIGLLARPAAPPPADATLTRFLDPLLRARPGAPAGGGLPTVDGYEVLAELGRGGMGIVYKAVHRELNRPVALKMVYAGPQLTDQTHLRLRDEARAIARLRHPNIVQIYDVGSQDGRPYFSLELVEGGSLAQRTGGRPQSPTVAARTVERLARAIDYAHRNHIVHRDLKPANVLLPADEALGEGDGLKITDFGLAKELFGSGDRLTESGATLGTPSYMAPEQARGQALAVGPAVDIYALGAVLYELLTGRPPFRATSPLETLVQVVHHEPVSVARLQPKVPRDLETICLKCLEKDPRRRYAAAAELADDLHRFLDHKPIRASRVGPAGRLARWGRRNPAPALLLVVLALVTAGGFFGILHQWRVATALAETEATLRAAAQKDRDHASAARRQAEHVSLRLVLDRGLALCEGREVGPGLLWLARGLEQSARVEASDLEPVFRANLAMWADRLITVRESPALNGPVTGVAYRRGGRQVAVVTAGKETRGDGQLVVWDVDTWSPVFPPVPLEGRGAAVAYSPDDKVLMALTATNRASSVRFWAADTGRPTAPSISLNAPMSAAAFSPDGATVVVGGGDETSLSKGTARVWDVATATPAGPALPHPGFVMAVAFSPDGHTVATGNRIVRGSEQVRSGGELRLWDPATGKPHRPPAAHTDAVRALAFHPSGKVLLTGCDDTVGRYWVLDTGARYGPLLSHPCPVTAVAFSSDGRLALTGGGMTARLGGGQDGAWLWDVTTGSCLAGPLPHPDVVDAVAFRPGGGGVATGGRDGRVRVWSLATSQPRVEIQRQRPFQRVSFSADGTRIMTLCRLARGHSVAETWNAQTGAAISQLFLSDEADQWSFAPDGLSGFVAKINRRPPQADGPGAADVLQHYDMTASPRSVMKVTTPPISTHAVAPDGRVVAAGGRDGAVRLWNAADGRSLLTLSPGHTGEVTALDFSPDGRVVASGGPDGAVRLWDVRTGAPLPSPHPVEKPVTVLRFDPTGRTLLIAAEHGVVRLWQLPEGRLSTSAIVLDPGESVRSAGFDPTGQFVFTASAPPGRDWALVRVWDVQTGMPTCPPFPERATAASVVFHPNGRFLAVGGWEGNVRLWDVLTGRPVGPRIVHNGAVSAVALDPTGGRLAAAGRDGLLRIWPIPAQTAGPPAEVRDWAERLTGSSLDQQR